MKLKLMIRKSPLRRISKLKHRLAKRVIPIEKKNAIIARSKGQCERWYHFDNGLSQRCPNPGETFHHVWKRSQGNYSHDLADTRHSCNGCNSDAEINPRNCIEDEWVKPWRDYKHPQDFQAYLTSKGLK